MQETSLRTPRRAQTRNATLPPALQVGVPRSAPKSRVDDRIKKRMSMRYAEMVASPTGNDAMPPLPEFPLGIGAGGEGMMNLDASFSMMGDEDVRDRTRSGTMQDDKKMLEDEKFDPDAFLKSKLANSTEAQLKSLQSSLREVREGTDSELQKNVFKNYAEFVFISKEITSLETEMLELKDLLSEYKYMPFLLHIPDPTMQSSNPNIISTYKRSSVADLRVLYFNQMQELHATIEGSAKFAPTTPGRHIVAEVEGVVSLNAATYRVIGRVRFVILDDLVLVARRRRRKAAGTDGAAGGGTINEGKLVAERCWPLNEMLVLDTKDSPRMTNVFKIRHGKETHVYRTETPQDKKSLLAQFRQVAEELASKKRKEREGEHERRKSMWQAGSGDRSSIPPMPEWMADLAKKGGEIPGIDSDMGAKQKAERDARWVADWADDLTVAIALREWEKGVKLVEEGKAKSSVMPTLAQKLPPLNSLLVSSLLDALSLPSIRKSAVVLIISYLCRLKAGPAARSTFLQMRTKVLKTHVRKIRFDGHIARYVGELAVVYFTGIKHTADWFLASFKENEVASAFIDWAKSQIEGFAEVFREQVFTSDVDPRVVEDALSLTHAQSRKLLQEYGLDFRFMLDQLLTEKPKTIILSLPQLTFQDPPPMPTLEPAPPPRRRTPAPLDEPSLSTSSAKPNARPPALEIDTLAPPPSTSMRSLSPGNAKNNTPLLNTPGSGYSSASHYSSISPGGAEGGPSTILSSVNLSVPNRERTRTPVASPNRGETVPLRTPQSPAMLGSLRPRTPGSAAPPSRSRTPVSAAPPSSSHPRTPMSTAPPLPTSTPSRPRTPASSALSPPPERDRDRDGRPQVLSPVPRRARSPPPITSPLRPGTREREREAEGDRDQSMRAVRNPVLPPRSVRRPGSMEMLVKPVVPVREGMF